MKKMHKPMCFYGGALNEAQSLQWLRDNIIAYVIEGEYERGAFPDTLPSSRFGWKPIWAQNGTAIYATP